MFIKSSKETPSSGQGRRVRERERETWPQTLTLPRQEHGSVPTALARHAKHGVGCLAQWRVQGASAAELLHQP